MQFKYFAVIVLAALVPAWANASLTGDTVTVSYGGWAYNSAAGAPRASSAVIGTGVEFMQSFTGVGNVWNITSDFTGNALNLSFVESTHPNGGSYNSGGPGFFTLDYSFLVSTISSVSLTAYSPTQYAWGPFLPAYNQSHLNLISLTGPHSIQLQFSALYSGETYSLSVAQVPEPETYAMMLAGLAMLGLIARRRASRSS